MLFCLCRCQVEYVKYSAEITISFEPYRQALLMHGAEAGIGLTSPSGNGGGGGDRPANKTHEQIAASFHAATTRA